MRYATLAERPDLVSAMWRMGNDWPEFMQHDPFGDVFFGRLPDVFPEWQQLLLNQLKKYSSEFRLHAGR